MQKFQARRHRRGLTLAELLVSMALFSVVSLVTLQLFLSAQTEFEHSSGQMTLNQRARIAVDRITQILKTGAPILNAKTEVFIHPNLANDASLDPANPKDMYEADFISSICFIPNSTLGSTWQVTDNKSAAYVSDPNDPRYIYENDLGLTAFVSRQPSLYRYRIAWNHLPSAALTTQGRNVPPRAVYFERLDFGNGNDNDGDLGWGEGYNSATYAIAPQIADTGRPMSGGNMKARIIARQVHLLTFTRSEGNVIMLRVKMYNRDPVTNIPVEGMTMRRSGFGGVADPNDRTKVRNFMVDISTNVQLPNTY